MIKKKANTYFSIPWYITKGKSNRGKEVTVISPSLASERHFFPSFHSFFFSSSISFTGFFPFCFSLFFDNLFLFFIVLRPCLVAGPVQGPGSRFWLGHQVLTGSPGQFFFFKSKRRRFSKKKKQKSTGLQPGLDRVLLGHTGFFLPPFFLQPGPVPALGRPGPRSTRGTGFQNYTFFIKKKKKNMEPPHLQGTDVCLYCPWIKYLQTFRMFSVPIRLH